MSTTTIEAARIAGALKGLDALRKLVQAAKEARASDSCDTATGYYARRLSDARAFVAALGSMTPGQEGAIAVLAEYIHSEINGGTPSLDPGDWTPLSAMTEAERQAMVDDVEAEQADDNAAIETARKVVSIADRNPAR